MSFKNALKIMSNKFGLVWAVLLYMFIATCIIVGVGAIFIQPIISLCIAEGVPESIVRVYEGFIQRYDMTEIFQRIKDVIFNLKAIFVKNGSVQIMSFIIPIVITFLYTFLLGLSKLPLTHTLKRKMSENAAVSFTGNVFSHIGISSKYALLKILVGCPFDILMMGTLYYLFSLIYHPVLSIAAPFLIMLALVVFCSLKSTVFAFWVPAIETENKRVFSALKSSVGLVFKHFGGVLSNFLVAWIFIIAVNVLFALMTFGVGLLLSVPMSVVFLDSLCMTMFFKATDRRYYVDNDSILANGRIIQLSDIDDLTQIKLKEEQIDE